MPPIDGGSLGMNVLALDSASAACSVALWCDEALRAHRFTAMARGHAEALMPMVEAVMAEARLAYADLDLIATTVGPGTFTG
ncbi:MAG: tRNA (adenosine(37)-N6)-threonylcarbamoyltransferase complex dimerization subunit type 1 TsaB, partial [Alphaproteobacteria bacterium]|nr:tRNA (adenosine(37)-N6)-threonylcarbamoyltransferase complex dimerization subunit type 1 TsaB [Alphaproteobacteria bacterium]